eukprot:XP_001695673.1 predicted protein [Chlamydomonas reinhardtii]
MNDFRLEHQQNAAAKILIRAPQLNLYASKNQLPPAIARFRLLQVLSQSPEEADPAPQPAGAIPPHHQRDEQQQAQDANNEPPAADADIDSESEGFESERDDAGDSDDDSLSDLEADEEFIAPLIENEEEGGEGDFAHSAAGAYPLYRGPYVYGYPYAPYGGNTEKDEGYMEALSQLHTYWANKLLEVCRRNGGVYVKAGQFAAAFGGVPREYRTVLAQLEDRAVPRPYRAVQYPGLAGSVAADLNEIRNSNRFREVLAAAGESGRVRVPQLHEHLCSSKVLVMEWIAGAKITDVEALTRQGINPRLVGRQLCRLFGELMFLQGYVHGDPHPGNLMVEPELRQQFCQLWCAVVMQDEATQADISTAMAGEAGGRILPLLLTQRARNRAEEAALRARLGIRGFGDMTALLSAVSRHLVDLLRVVTVIRASSAALGVTMPERLRIYSQVAAKGLPPRRPNGKRPTFYIHKSFTSAAYRAKLRAVLLGLGLYAWGSSLLGRTWDALLSVFGEALFE